MTLISQLSPAPPGTDQKLGETTRPAGTLGKFGDFVVAPSSAKIAVLRQAIALYNRDYGPGHDVYKGWRDAFVEAVPTQNDQLHLHRAAALATKPRLQHYAHLIDGLMRWTARKNLAPRYRESAVWGHPRADVRARIAALLKDGSDNREMATYLKEAPLTTDAAEAMLRILERTNPSLDHGVLDVRRAKLHRPQPIRSQHFDAWLTGEVAMFATMRSRLAAAA
ncbi:hypothetical protein [Modestobacter sp. VKM Ac-2986]|uniref:hypothetical protein n=1 Tax=Modestobacter sp. VKM Ac-2986 TaxID=3004140 RepID=UPI0022AB4EFE|nr:hypothetical protein [Modestobacter sp. VKM Ac-2986]